jgi:hypothetical protein
LERNFFAQFNSSEKIIDLSRDQVHFAPQENEDQKEKEEIDYPENPDNIHKRREGTKTAFGDRGVMINYVLPRYACK